MTGILVEKVIRDGCQFWVVKDARTNQIVSIGETPSKAVSAYEVIIENEKMAAELGVSLDDMDF